MGAGRVRNSGDRAERGPGEAAERSQAAPAPPTVDVGALLSGRGEAILLHGGERYRLRITSRGKLILTK